MIETQNPENMQKNFRPKNYLFDKTENVINNYA